MHRERVQEHDLDVEDDEEHRRQVEADREALLLRRPRRDAGLERDRARACGGSAASRTTNDITIIEAGIASAKSP